jgi:DNA repair protein RadC
MEAQMTLDPTVGIQGTTSPRSLSEQIQALLKAETKVAAMTGYYLVTFAKDVHPRNHLVRKDKTCACELGADCPAVQVVAEYLKAGGRRAADVPAHHLIPAACPVCGGAVKFAPRLCSPVRGAGWVCLEAAKTETSVWPEPYHTPGESHYWQFMWARLAAALRLRRQMRDAHTRAMREPTPSYGAQPLLMDVPYPPAAHTILPLRERPNYRMAVDSRTCNLLEVLTVLTGKEETAKALLTKYGSASAIANTSVLEMAQSVKGISQTLATRIKAAAEFGRRVAVEWPDEMPLMNSPADGAAILMPLMQHQEQEYLYVLLLNTRNRLIGQPVEVYHGSLNTSLIRTGEVFREAIRLNAAAIIVAHNHPSGDPSPSPEDVAVTRALVEAGKLLDIEVLDHLVVGRQRFVSLKERGLGFN